MAAQKGRDMLLKVDTTGAGVFAAVAGLRARRTGLLGGDRGRHGRRQPGPLARADRRRRHPPGRDFRRGHLPRWPPPTRAVRAIFFNGTLRNWQVTVPDFGTVTGPFQVVKLAYAGTHDGEATYELALDSAAR